jgi:hypothetical protein
MPEARTTITATGIKKDSSSTSNVYSYRCERSRFSKSSSYYIKSATCVVAIIEETISVLGTDAHEVLVERPKPLRNNPGPNEGAFVTEFNDLMAQAPA